MASPAFRQESEVAPFVRSRSVSVAFPQYFCDVPVRKTICEENYRRRTKHEKSCGLFSSRTRPYVELGKTELDYNKLVLSTLKDRQIDSNAKLVQVLEDYSLQPKSVNTKEAEGPTINITQATLNKVELQEHQNMDDVLDVTSQRMKCVKKGQSLFKVLSDADKVEEIKKEQQQMETEREKSAWIDPETSVHHPESLVVDEQLLFGVIDDGIQDNQMKDESSERITFWTRKLCFLWWILEGTRQYPNNFIPLRECLKLCFRNQQVGIKQPPLLPNRDKSFNWIYTQESDKKDSITFGRSQQHGGAIVHTETIPAARSSAKLQKVVDASRAKFNQVDMEQQLILHEQLSLHQNQYTSKIQRRFSKFKCTGNVWTDTAGVRTVAPIESAAAAFKRLHLNSSWMDDLLSELPQSVKTHYGCQIVLRRLEDISRFTKRATPQQMSSESLFKVLGRLRQWELLTPEVEEAVKFVIEKVIYVKEQEFRKWLVIHRTNDKSKLDLL